MRLLVPLIAVVVFGLTSCCCKEDKLEMRRDLWGSTKVEGPYTRMIKRGIPRPSSPFEAPDAAANAKVAKKSAYGK